jgi:hypothetical protein
MSEDIIYLPGEVTRPELQHNAMRLKYYPVYNPICYNRCTISAKLATNHLQKHPEKDFQNSTPLAGGKKK